MLVDIVEATDRFDLLLDLAEAKTDAENAVTNTLVFGLHNRYTLSVDQSPGQAAAAYTGAVVTVTVPLISVDPYPHHVVAGVQLLRKTIDRDHASGKMAGEAYGNLHNTLEQTLSHLPQCSKSVQAARIKGMSHMDSAALPLHEPPVVLHAEFAP